MTIEKMALIVNELRLGGYVATIVNLTPKNPPFVMAISPNGDMFNLTKTESGFTLYACDEMQSTVAQIPDLIASSVAVEMATSMARWEWVDK